MVVGHVPPIHIVHIYFLIKYMLPFSHVWGDVKLLWHSSLNLCVSWFVDTTPIVTSDQCFILNSTYQPCPKQASRMNQTFHSAQMIDLHSHNWSKQSMFSWPINLEHSSHGLLTGSSFIEWGRCKSEAAKDSGKLCFGRAIVKSWLLPSLSIHAVPIDSHSCSHSWLIYILMAGWTE